MGVESVLRMFWICFLLFGGSIGVPLEGYKPSVSDHGEIGGAVDHLEASPTQMLGSHGQVAGDAAGSDKALLAAAPKQPLLGPKRAAENQRVGAMGTAKMVTYPLMTPYQHEGLGEQSASKEPQFKSDVDEEDYYSSNQVYEDVFKYPSQDAELPSKEVDSNYDTVNAKESSTWSSAPYESKEPAFSSNSADWALADSNYDSTASYISPEEEQELSAEWVQVTDFQYTSTEDATVDNSNYDTYISPEEEQELSAEWVQAATTSNGARTFAAEKVSSDDCVDSQNIQVGVKDGLQSYYSNFNNYKYPSAGEKALPSNEFRKYGSTSSYMTRKGGVDWAQPAPTSNSAQTLEAEQVSSGGTSQNIQVGVKGGSQMYSNLDYFKYPSGEELPSTEVGYYPSYKAPVKLAFSSDSTDWTQAAPTLEAEKVSSGAVGASQNIQVGVKDGLQSYYSNFDNYKYPSAGKKALPSNEFRKYGSTSSYMTRKGGVDWAQPAPTLEATAESSQNLKFLLDVEDGLQSYTPNTVNENLIKYPEVAAVPLAKEVYLNYESVNAVAPSMWSSASYQTPEDEPETFSKPAEWRDAASNIAQNWAESSGTKGGEFYSSHNLKTQGDVKAESQNNFPTFDAVKQQSAEMVEPTFKEVGAPWTQAAHFKSLASPNYGSDLTMDYSRPVHYQPIKKVPQLPSTQQLQMPQIQVNKPVQSTYIIQRKGGYRRGRKVYSNTRYSTGFPPLPQSVKQLRNGKW